jgi:DNA mismatch endonuclease (patch repair protein)
MERQRRRDTRPELDLRKALHAAGYRFRVNYPVPGQPRRSIDVAFTKQRLAVFVDGCFWHGCQDHGVSPRNNSTWWAEKLERNRQRDLDVSRHLEEAGWRVIRLWEHEAVADQLARLQGSLRSEVAERAVASEAPAGDATEEHASE